MKLDEIRALIVAALLAGCSVEVPVSSFREAEKSCQDGWVRLQAWTIDQSIRFLCKDGKWGPWKK